MECLRIDPAVVGPCSATDAVNIFCIEKKNHKKLLEITNHIS